MAGELSAFQQMVEDDARMTFLNTDEFASEHKVEGKTIMVVYAPDMRIPVGGGYELGIADSSVVIHAKIEDLPKRREAGQSLNVDGREYKIDRWNEHQGMAEISLSQTRSQRAY